MRIVRLMCLAVFVAAAAGCAAPVSQYYTLATNDVPDAGAAVPAPPPAAKRGFAISVQPVALPEQVDRPQLVISGGADNTQVQILNSSLWAAPLADEMRNALAGDLARQLGVLDLDARVAPKTLPVWKISLTVQRFGSLYGHSAILDATWRLTPLNQKEKAVAICRAEVRIPVGAGIAALVEGHRAALHQIAILIAAQLSHRDAPDLGPGIVLKGCA